MRARTYAAGLVVAAFLVAACASVTQPGGDTGNDTAYDPWDAADMDATDAADGLPDAPCSGGLTNCYGACVNLTIDPDHCGGCDTACTAGGPNMVAQCVSGGCQTFCADGFWDVDPAVPGCEYACTFASGAEECNGADDNCDGNADEGFPCSAGAETPCTTVCSTLGTGTCGTHCEIPAAADCAVPAEQCNGMDDDCDGDVDEDWVPGACGECVPDCSGRECGMDPVCYTSCGTCDPATEICEASGTCACVPACTGRECGPDPSCGTPCGTCTLPEVCNASGICAAPCTPSCSGRECGPDPVCGTSCGTCTTPETCDGAGQCVGGCTPTTETCNGLDDDCNSVADDGAGMDCVRSATGLYCLTGGGEVGTRDCTTTCTYTECCAYVEECGNGWDDDCDGFDDATDPDCPTGPGTTCADAIDVTSLATWSGNFSDFGNYWSGGWACGGAGGSEAWFTATVAPGDIFAVTETSLSDVVIEIVGSCSASTCSEYEDEPETWSYHNETTSPRTVYFIVERYSGTSGALSLTFTNESPPEGYDCPGAIDVTGTSSWTGSLADYQNDWSGGYSCGGAAGREIWFTATIPAGNIFKATETSGSDVVIQRITSCSASTCTAYWDEPETMEIHNDSASPLTLFFIVEAYYSTTTGTVTLTFTNTAPPSGYTCAGAIDVTSTPSWSGALSSYQNDWSGGYSCGGAAGREVWFEATVAAGDTFSVTETSGTDVVIERVSGCSATTCAAYSDTPESLEYYNTTGSPQTVYVIVEAYSSGSTGTVSLTFTNGPPPEGYGCASAIDVTSPTTWTGSFADYEDLWDGGYSCGSAYGPEVWFTATVPAGNIITIAETLSVDVVVERVASCAATTCTAYSDSPESLTWFNGTASSATLYLVVEKYSSGTGSLSVTTTNSPAPAGYTCANAIDMTGAASWSGNFSSFQDVWTGGSGCGYASGPEIWFTATVQPGDTFTLAETGTQDVVIERVASCSATACGAYSDSPESLSYTNSGGSPVTIWMIVERYSDGTGAVTVTATNG